jgi:hypothetical protein
MQSLRIQKDMMFISPPGLILVATTNIYEYNGVFNLLDEANSKTHKVFKSRGAKILKFQLKATMQNYNPVFTSGPLIFEMNSFQKS